MKYGNSNVVQWQGCSSLDTEVAGGAGGSQQTSSTFLLPFLCWADCKSEWERLLPEGHGQLGQISGGKAQPERSPDNCIGAPVQIGSGMIPFHDACVFERLRNQTAGKNSWCREIIIYFIIHSLILKH